MHSRRPLPGARGHPVSLAGPPRCGCAATVIGPVLKATLPPLATAEQVAATITYLLSEDASNINGAVIARAAAGPPSEKGAGECYWQVKSG